MKKMPLAKAFTLLEPGPVVLVTTNDGKKNNVMTISWMMVMDFTPRFAITTGPWNHSYAALRKTRECVLAVPTVDLLDTVVGIGTCSGADVDKFERFGLTAVRGKQVGAHGSPNASRTSSAASSISCASTTSSCSRASRPTSTLRDARSGRSTRSVTEPSSSMGER